MTNNMFCGHTSTVLQAVQAMLCTHAGIRKQQWGVFIHTTCTGDYTEIVEDDKMAGENCVTVQDFLGGHRHLRHDCLYQG